MSPDFHLAAGEALIDLIEAADGRFEPCLGGSVFNFTIALARQGLPTAYANPLSHDSFGRRFARRLQQAGVHHLLPQPSACPTSLAVVSLGDDGSPAYAFHRADVADRDFSIDQWQPFLAQTKSLHVGGLALVPDDAPRYLAAMAGAAAQGALISVDANLRPQVERRMDAYRVSVQAALALAHIVKVSDEDLIHLGLAEAAASDGQLLAVARQLLSPTTRLVALTFGARGASLLTRQFTCNAAPPGGLEVQDTVGAGDCFMAGLLAELTHLGAGAPSGLQIASAQTLAQALAHAVAAAAINVTRTGCNPATGEQTRALRNQVVVTAGGH